MNKFVLLLIITLASPLLFIAQNKQLETISNLQEFVAAAKKDKWEQAKQKDGITISYRDLELFETIETRELLLEFNIRGSLDSILSQIKQPDKLKSWNDGVSSAELLKDIDANWIMHTVYDIPWPFSQQDLVASYNIERRKDSIIISSRSLPDFIKPVEGITREGYNLSQWLIIAKHNSLFEIKFSAISLTNSSIPRWIKDPLIQRMLIKSFGKFKKSVL